jgi:hypothetical protein
VSTNSTTPANLKTKNICSFWIANIRIRLNSQRGIGGILVFLLAHKNKTC